MAATTKTVQTTIYAVLLIDRGVGRVLLKSHDREEAGRCYQGAKKRHTRPEHEVKLVSREQTWDILAEL